MTAIPYVCTGCGASGCKLWREYQTFADVPVERGHRTSLLCADCVELDQGRALDETRPDAIGWRVAAVPADEGTTFWGFASVPEDRVAWWRALPTRPARGVEVVSLSDWTHELRRDGQLVCRITDCDRQAAHQIAHAVRRAEQVEARIERAEVEAMARRAVL